MDRLEAGRPTTAPTRFEPKNPKGAVKQMNDRGAVAIERTLTGLIVEMA
jgi:hypothetical protein